MSVFTATTRVPTRPLSYANRHMAYNKELVVDYTNGMLWVVDENGNLISIAGQVYKYMLEEGLMQQVFNNLIVKIPKPGFDINNPPDINNPADDNKFDKVVLPAGIFQAFFDIEVIRNNIANIQNFIKNITGGSTDGLIDPNKIRQDATHMFITKAQLDALKKKVTIVEHIVSINPNSITGNGTTASPYQCTITVNGAKSSYPSPHISISYTGTDTATMDSNGDNFACIKHAYFETDNKCRLVFESKPTAVFNIKVQLFVPGFV